MLIDFIYTGWAKSRVTLNVKCLNVNCNTTFGPPCIYYVGELFGRGAVGWGSSFGRGALWVGELFG